MVEAIPGAERFGEDAFSRNLRANSSHSFMGILGCLGYPSISKRDGHAFNVIFQHLLSGTFFPKATAKGSFEKSTTIKDCRSDRCLERLSSKTTEVIRVLKDCHQRLPQ